LPSTGTSAARVRDPRDFYSLRQLLANAAIAASHVGSRPCASKLAFHCNGSRILLGSTNR
jgi:hypothetical protein